MGLHYPNIVEISDISGPGGGHPLRDPAVGTALTTGRTDWPGQRVSLRCRASDRDGRDLHCWLQQYDGFRQCPVIGDDVVLSWDLDTAAIGESVHVGIGGLPA